MPPGGGQQQDNSLGPLWIMLMVCAVVGVSWYLFHAYLMLAFLAMKSFELSLLGFFTSSLDGVRRFAAAIPPASMTLEQAHFIAASIGQLLMIPCALILLFFAWRIYANGSATAYRKIYGMKTLAQAQASTWPQIKPVVPIDLIKMDIRTGPWAMALTPMEFAKQKKLIIEEAIMPLEDELLRHKRIVAKLDKGKANALFILQLGRLWRGYDALPPYLQALFGVFAAKAQADRDAAYALLAELSNTYSTEKNTVSCQDPTALGRQYMKTKGVQLVLSAHAYELTVMASMLELARCDGVLSSSDFLWLKPVDRRAWFMLNAVGRRTPVPEAAAIFAHWLAEKELGRRSVLPRVDAATQALELGLTEIMYRRDEPESET